MICGTIQLEDQTLHFHLTPDGDAHIRVQDGLTGETAEIQCLPRQFAASLALALDPAGMEGEDTQAALYELAEFIPFPSDTLRWIP